MKWKFYEIEETQRKRFSPTSSFLKDKDGNLLKNQQNFLKNSRIAPQEFSSKFHNQVPSSVER